MVEGYHLPQAMSLILILTVLGFAIGAWFLLLAYEDTYGLPAFLFWDLTRISTIKLPNYSFKRPKYRLKRSNSSRRSSASISKSSKEYRRLLELVRYDQATAARLIKYAKNCNPGKSDNWAIEKALWDLERDRF